MSEQGPKQIPIPCRTCGAPMRERPSEMVVGPIVVECTFCHATEELPRDLAERVRGLKARLAKIRWAEQAEEGPAIAIARTIEYWRQHTLPMVLGMVALMALSLGLQVSHQAELPGATPGKTIVGALFGVVSYLFPIVSVIGGTFWALRGYRSSVLPNIEARAPLAPGAPLRCRSCGGELPPDGLGGFVRCAYCGAENLVTQEIAAERQKKLDAELHIRQLRAAGMQVRVREAAERYKNRLYLFMGIAVGGSLLLSQLHTRIVLAF